MSAAASIASRDRTPEGERAGYNLAGQRLGRKGQETRERIITAALRLFDDSDGPPATLTGVARAAEVRLTNLYLYFPDFGSLLLAALQRMMADAEAGFIDRLKRRWPDAALGDSCLGFLLEHCRFWQRHSRILHLRNALSDTDPRILEYRQEAAKPLLDLLLLQMDGDRSDADLARSNMATVVLTGFERMATVVTNPHFHAMANAHDESARDTLIDGLIRAEARLLELAIRDCRASTETHP